MVDGRRDAPLQEVRHMFESIKTFVVALGRDKKGATAIEYGLIAALIAVAVIGAVTLVGNNLQDTFNAISGNL